MKLVGNILAFTVAVGILAAIGWGGYIGINFLVNQYEIINPQLAAILIISSVVILISALIIAGAIRSLDKGSDKQIHPEKAVLYSRFIESCFESNHDDRREQLKELEKQMVIWAGDEVLRKYLKLIEHMKDGKQQQADQIKDIVTAIRRELGADNKDIDFDRVRELLSSSENTTKD